MGVRGKVGILVKISFYIGPRPFPSYKWKCMMNLSLSFIESQLSLGHAVNECPYLPENETSLLFLDGFLAGGLYRQLMDEGYRRYGRHLYRPDCTDCRECKILRLNVDEFAMSKSQRRIWKKGNEALRMEVHSNSYSPEKDRLYEKYLEGQHGTIETMEPGHYRDFFVESFLEGASGKTLEMQYFHNDTLMGVGIVDVLGDAFSSVYFFFDPEFKHLSPGVYSVLNEIRWATVNGYHYYYPGYYIAGAKTMNYKINYRPCEIRNVGEMEWKKIDR